MEAQLPLIRVVEEGNVGLADDGDKMVGIKSYNELLYIDDVKQEFVVGKFN